MYLVSDGDHIMKRILAVGMIALLAAGCYTPASRIKKNPELFAGFPEDVQANVKAGRIDIGYTKDMVFIALGKPDRQYSRQTATGLTEVWAYITYETTTDRQRIDGRFRGRDSTGVYRTVDGPAWVDVQQKREYEKLRVEFEGDTVRAIERMER